MYTIEPITNLAGNHTGFFFVVGLAVVLLYAVISDIKHDGISTFNISLVVASLLIVIVSGFVSYSPGNNIPPKNEQTVATFLRYVPQQKSYGCGKNNRDTCYNTLAYAEFRLNDNSTVLLPVNPNLPMPPRVILYKN